jgi:hypothetical protein
MPLFGIILLCLTFANIAVPGSFNMSIITKMQYQKSFKHNYSTQQSKNTCSLHICRP